MTAPDYLIQNCTAADVEVACPTQWSQLKPALMAAVRDCHHCNRKVYLCTTDADLKLYTSLKYCIAVIAPQALTEKESQARTTTQQRPVRRAGIQTVEGEVLMSIPARATWPVNSRRAPGLRVLPEDLAAYDIPAYLRKQVPKTDDDKQG